MMRIILAEMSGLDTFEYLNLNSNFDSNLFRFQFQLKFNMFEILRTIVFQTADTQEEDWKCESICSTCENLVRYLYGNSERNLRDV